mmetsp:Transcript_25779/g.59913  ORF Transcript_25779/g.59913 Transcript_25779/m.59913 type:complete len:336 (-) Transcript_25779:714-1721(-)
MTTKCPIFVVCLIPCLKFLCVFFDLSENTRKSTTTFKIMNSWWARCLLLASSLPAWSRVTSFSPSTCSRRVKTSLDMVWGEPAPERYRLPIAKKTEYDWREYRAYLVRDADEISVEEEARALERSDPKLAKQSELGNAFADALLSIFQKERRQNNNNNSHRINNNHRINIHNNSPEMRKKTTKKRSSRGHLVVKPSTASVLTDGNPNRSWIHEANIETQEDVTAFGGKQMLSLLEEQRMMPLAKKKAVTRTLPKTFAHLLPYAEVGSVLLSSECLSGNFHQTVVLIVEQSEERGTIGVIINRYVCVWNIHMKSLDSCFAQHVFSLFVIPFSDHCN